jgi:hypothetical protein
MAKLAILLLVLSLSPGIGFAQVPVQVVHSGNDAVGQRLVFYFKEAIRGSTSFSVALEPTLGLRVWIVTLDPDNPSRAYSTVYSAAWTWNNPNEPFDYFLTQYVGTCGSQRVRSCAEDLLVATNSQLERLQRLLSPVRR